MTSFRITHELLGQLTSRKETFKENKLSAEQLGEIIDLVQGKKITGTIYFSLTVSGLDFITGATGTSGRSLLRHVLAHNSSESPTKLAEQMSLLVSESDNTSLRTWCKQIIAEMPEESQAIRNGHLNVVNKMVGRVMKLSKGRADAKAVRTTLETLLATK